MTNYYNDNDSILSAFLDVLNQYCPSKTLKNYFSDLFESFIYSNLIENFFVNLTEENIVDYNLPTEKVDDIKNEFKDLRENLKIPSSMSLEKKMGKDSYEDFKITIQQKYPEFTKIIDEMEKLIDIGHLEKYIENKKEIINASGKTEGNSEDYIITKVFEVFVDKHKRFPDLDDPELSQIILDKEFQENVPKDMLEKFSRMKLKDWDIWHSYSSYYINNIKNPELIARKLVEKDICPLVFASNAEYWYKSNNKVKKQSLKIKRLDQSRFEVEGLEALEGYPQEVLWQAARMWYKEVCLFSEKYRQSFPYLRCYFNACYLKRGHGTIALYPQIKLYANGTYNLIFREIAPSDFTYYLEAFIENEVNLPKHRLDCIEIPPELMKYRSRSKYKFEISRLPFHKKIKRIILKNRFIKNTDSFIEKNTKEVKEEDFSFKVFPLKTTSRDLYLKSLCRIIIFAFTHVIGQTSVDIKNVNDHATGDWTLRPSIYILEFIDQPNSSHEIIDQFGDQLGKIMARISNIQYNDFNEFLGKNLRRTTFGDYTLHINNALSLWTMSKKGLLSTQHDPNRGDIIYEKQIQTEAVEHLYLSHWRLLDKSALFSTSYDSIMSEDLDLLNLEELVTDTNKIGNFGEIDEIINYSDNELGWNSIRKSIEKKLELRSKYATQEQNKFYQRFSVILAIIFGVGGLTIFTKEVLSPILSHYNVPLYVNPEVQVPFLSLLIIIVVILILISYLMNKK